MRILLMLLSLLLTAMISANAAEPAKKNVEVAVGANMAAQAAPAMLEQVPLHGRVKMGPVGRQYLLGPNDILDVSVYDSPEFEQKELLVQPDGNLNIAPFGSVFVAGMSIQDLQQELTERYKYYLNEPKVSVRLAHSKPFVVYVSGAVQKPGSYEIVTDISRDQMSADQRPQVLIERKTPLLSNILFTAGGVSYDADLEHVKIKNSYDDSEFEVNLLEMIQEGGSEKDLYLVAGDSVTVPRLSSAFAVDDENYNALLGSTIFQDRIPVRIYGYIRNPGLVQLDTSQSANLNSAIVAAGGYMSDAAYAPGKVYISRADGHGKLVTRTVDPREEDVTLRPNDVVYVPDKVRSKVAKVFDYATRLVAPAATAASGFNNWALLFNPTRYNNFTYRP